MKRLNKTMKCGDWWTPAEWTTIHQESIERNRSWLVSSTQGPKLLYARDTLLLCLMLRDMDAIPSGAGEWAAIQACPLPLESHLWLLFTSLKDKRCFSFFFNWTEEKSPVEKCRVTKYDPPRNINVVILDVHVLSVISLFIYKFNFFGKDLLSWSWNRKSSWGIILYLFTHWNSPDFRPFRNN